jgi:ATP-dependent 26S proteasome regulatory subunit
MLSQLSKETKELSSKVTFKDVGGQDELIKELKRSILYPLKYPDMYETFDVNKGFILYGPPGTGKTHIARALANEADAAFFPLNGLEMESNGLVNLKKIGEIFLKRQKKSNRASCL